MQRSFGRWRLDLSTCTRVQEGGYLHVKLSYGIILLKWTGAQINPGDGLRMNVVKDEGEGGLFFDKKKSHDAINLVSHRWATEHGGRINLVILSFYNELSWALEGGGWTSVRGWRRAVLWDNNFHGWKISWNCLFKMNLSLRWALEDGVWTSIQG